MGEYWDAPSREMKAWFTLQHQAFISVEHTTQSRFNLIHQEMAALTFASFTTLC